MANTVATAVSTPLPSFTFDKVALRVYGTPDNPLFVAADVCKALHISNVTNAMKALAPCEISTVTVEQENPLFRDPLLNKGSEKINNLASKSGKRNVPVLNKGTLKGAGSPSPLLNKGSEKINNLASTPVISREVNAVNESGLYTLILRSREAIKEGSPAYRFRMKVTQEILPTIRRQGRYCPLGLAQQQQLPLQKVNSAEAQQIAEAVKGRCGPNGVSYQTLYRDFYRRFQIPSYRDLPSARLQEALEWIAGYQGVKGHWIQVQEGDILLAAQDAQILCNVMHLWTGRFKEIGLKFAEVLRLLESPLAGVLHEMCTQMSHIRLVRMLEQRGFSPAL